MRYPACASLIVSSLCIFWFSKASVALDIVFEETHTKTCVMESESYDARFDCIGASANHCAESIFGGSSTPYVREQCFQAEYQYWNMRLSQSYKKLETEYHEQASASGPKYNTLIVPLRYMQKTWISYRDANCAFHKAQTGQGSSADATLMECLMRMTAEQTLRLEGWSLK